MTRVGARLDVRPLSGPGLVFALAGFAISLTPSLIPRTWAFQALASGISVCVGYATGSLIGWAARRGGVRPVSSGRARRGWSIGFGIVAAAVVVTFTVLGARWQTQLHDLFGMGVATWWYALVPIGAAIVAVLLLLVARKVRAAVVWAARSAGLQRESRASRVAGFVAVAAALVLVISGTLGDAVMAGVRGVSAIVDERTDRDLVRPSSSERSGSPASEVTWESLGAQGRRFVATGPTRAELAEFAGTAQVPIRVYAGIETESSLADRADVVVAELNRTDAWSRDVLVVVTTTGAGWVDPAMADSLELMFGGDTAIAAMQYTYLPSWASALSDRDLPPDAGEILFEAIHAEWLRQPAGNRPDLYVFGESLGSYGSQQSFGTLANVIESVDGALWVGTPNNTPLWRRLTDARDPESREIEPVYRDGRRVRWSAASDEVNNVGGTWNRPRVLYLQHPSDVVTWWSPDLITSEPDWLREPRGHDVLPDLEWLPLVTFWQLTIDITHATNVAAGHGHKYWLEYIDAWTALARPPDWSAADRERLYDIMIERAIAEEVIITGTDGDEG